MIHQDVGYGDSQMSHLRVGGGAGRECEGRRETLLSSQGLPPRSVERRQWIVTVLHCQGRLYLLRETQIST
jgi:hypothetical protein